MKEGDKGVVWRVRLAQGLLFPPSRRDNFVKPLIQKSKIFSRGSVRARTAAVKPNPKKGTIRNEKREVQFQAKI